MTHTLSRIATIAALTALTSMTFASAAFAGTPVEVPLQGLLADADGAALDGATPVTFTIYGDATSDEALWTSEVSVDVDQGLFEVYLGAQDELDSDLFAAHPDAHLSMTIEGDDESGRLRLGAVPFAAHAASATVADDAFTVQGKTPEELGAASNVAFDDTQSQLGASDTQSALEALAQRIDALEQANQNLQMQAANNDTAITAVESVVTTNSTAIASVQNDVTANASDIATVQSDVSGNTSDITELQTKTASMSLATINGADSVLFTGVNVHVRNGTDSTNGTPNGTGNLIVGYDEARNSGSDKSGSHNIVLGTRANYTSYGGLIGGDTNTISGSYASVIGGRSNEASGDTSVVIGGFSNEASAFRSAVVAGYQNLASGSYSALLSGFSNDTSAHYSGIIAGRGNTVSASYGAILSGRDNEVTTMYSAIGAGEGLTNSQLSKFQAEGSISP